MADPELTRLVVAARNRDRAAFESLVLLVQDRAAAFCYGRLGQWEPARDATQDALVDAYLRLPQLHEPAAFWGWFRTVLLKHCDRRVRRKRPDPAELERHVGEQSAAVRDGEATALDRERDLFLRRAIELLPEHERVVVALHYLGDASIAQIGALLELDGNTVKQRLFAARKRLREGGLAAVEAHMRHLKPSNGAALSNVVLFFTAIRTGDEALVRTLLARDPMLLAARESWDVETWPDRDVPLPGGATALIRAAESGHVAVLKLLLDAGAEMNAACGCATEESPLWAAVVTGQLATAEELLRRGAAACGQTRRGVSCLHVAAMRNDRALFDLLLAHGADAEHRDAEGRTANDWARLKASEASSSAPMIAGATSGDALPAATVFESGIKALDLFAPVAVGGLRLIEGGVGLGRNILLAELAMVARRRGDTASIWVAWEREAWSDAELQLLLNETHMGAHIQLLTHAHARDEMHAHTLPERALALAESQLGGAIKHVELTFFESPGMRASIEALVPAFGPRVESASISVNVAAPVRDGNAARPHTPQLFDASVAFDRSLAAAVSFPAIDPLRTSSKLLEQDRAEPSHRACVREARALLALLGADTTGQPLDQRSLERARRLRAYLTQPFHVAEPFSARSGVSVPLSTMLADVRLLLDGGADHMAIADIAYGGALPG